MLQNLMILLGIAGLVLTIIVSMGHKQKSKAPRKQMKRDQIRIPLEVLSKAKYDPSRDQLRRADLCYVFTKSEIIRLRKLANERGSLLDSEFCKMLNKSLKDPFELGNGYFASRKDEEIRRAADYLETELERLKDERTRVS